MASSRFLLQRLRLTVGLSPASFTSVQRLDALEEYQRELTLDGDVALSAEMGKAYASHGWEGVLRKQIEVFQRRNTDDYDPVAVAQAYTLLADKDEAFLWLEKAHYEHVGGLLFIKATPAFDNIRSDPRYADLLRRMGLPQ